MPSDEKQQGGWVVHANQRRSRLFAPEHAAVGTLYVAIETVS
jgi:hypothetical protein